MIPLMMTKKESSTTNALTLNSKISPYTLFQTSTRASHQLVSAAICQDTQVQNIQGLGFRERDTLV